MKVGDYVVFEGQDSRFEGAVVCVFNKIGPLGKLDGPERCVVQDERGILLIKNPGVGCVTYTNKL